MIMLLFFIFKFNKNLLNYRNLYNSINHLLPLYYFQAYIYHLHLFIVINIFFYNNL